MKKVTTNRSYKGIREGYPQVKSWNEKLAAYFQLTRPFTLIAPAFVGIVCSAMCVDVIKNFHLVLFVTTTLIFAQMISQVVNQASEPDLDALIRSYRPIPSGKISVDEAFGLSWLFGIFIFLRAFTINPTFGALIAIILFFGIFYSLPPLRLKKFLGLNLTWISLSRGFLPPLVIFSAYTYPLTKNALILGVLGFLWCLAFQSSKDMQDSDGDLKFGIRTIPNVFGAGGLIFVSVFFSALFFIFSFLAGVYAELLLVPLAVVGILGFNKQVWKLENTVSWVIFYTGLALIYVLFLFSI